MTCVDGNCIDIPPEDEDGVAEGEEEVVAVLEAHKPSVLPH